MPKISLNGQSYDVSSDATVADLLNSAGFGERRVAVEINREIVPRSLHDQRRLTEGDQVEIVHALGGG